MLPLPLIVVATGAPIASARRSSATSPPAVIAPPPQMKSGAEALAMASAAARIDSGSGTARRPDCGPARTSSSSTAPFWTSKGSPIWAAPGRPVVIALKAARRIRGMSTERSITAFHLVAGRNSAAWSISVRVNRPREDTEMSEVMASRGTEDSLASTTPGRM